MVFVKFRSEKCLETPPSQDLLDEENNITTKVKGYLKDNERDRIEYCSLRRTVETTTEKAREELKELSVKIGFLLQPKDRFFTKHIILMEGNNVAELFSKFKGLKDRIDIKNKIGDK